MNTVRENEAWYHNPWVWLVIAIPSLTVAGCLFTIYLALTHPDHLVRDPAGAGVPRAEQASP
ncbi:MAG TPA: hypothetical protein VKZ85_10785 [Woeseiaceae bacterium]|nr:hypothetical protein [Woeseiaceae bacterium]